MALRAAVEPMLSMVNNTATTSEIRMAFSGMFHFG